MTDKDTREAEDQFAGTARPHSERPGFMRAHLNPEMEAFARSMVRQIIQEQAQIKPEVSAPGSPGGAVPDERGPATSEYGYTKLALYIGAGLALLFAALAVLSAFGYRVDLEYVRQLAELFQWMVIGIVGYSATRAVTKAAKR